MTQFLTFMLLPMAACLLLAGIHGYLGVHVINREIIFTDLAMAQVAAVGAAVAMLLKFEIDSIPAYAFSLAFTFAGAVVLSFSRLRDHRVPQEAIIGVVYAVSAALVILILSYAPNGAEHVEDLLVGHILWVNKGEVLVELIVYGGLGLVFLALSRKLHLVSFHLDLAREQGLNLFLWDVVFYALFGVVVTVSVRVAGVLLVFAFLVVPAIIAFLFFDNLRVRLLFAWSIGAAVSVLGCILSFKLDWPTGATVVVTFGAALILAGIISRLVALRAGALDAKDPIRKKSKL
jgi:zinc/manganese transport system permease protein